jgi:hypothetical protein
MRRRVGETPLAILARMRFPVVPRGAVVLLGLSALVPTPASSQVRPQPIAAVRLATASPAPPLSPRWPVNAERRRAILGGIQVGAFVGALGGLGLGLLYASVRSDVAEPASSAMLGIFAGLPLGAVGGGLLAARRYDTAHRPPPNVSLHLTGRPRTVPSSGEPRPDGRSSRLHGARR